MTWTLEHVPPHLADGVAQALLRMGDSAGAGRLTNALHAQIEARSIADPANTDWQRDLFVTHLKLGDLHMARGEGDAALERYRAGLDIRERLAAADPANTDWQRGLSVSHERLGDLHRARGEGDAALERFRAGLDIRERLVATDPANTGWQRDLSVSHNRLGDLHRARGEGDAALKRYRAGFDIAERLAATDPTNTEWQRDLIVSCVKLAEAGDDPPSRYGRALEIAQTLSDTGRLQPADGWMVEELKKRLRESQ